MLLLTYITLLSACGGEDIEPTPWEAMGAVELSSLHVPLSASIEGSVAPREIMVVDGITAVLDSTAGRVSLLDDRLGHNDTAHCLYDERFGRFEAGAAQRGDCAEGEVEIRRGVLSPGGVPVAFTRNSDGSSGIWLVDHLGGVYFADTDILLENPFDYLRLFSVFDTGLNGSTSIAVGDGTVWIAEGDSLYSYTSSGEYVGVEVFPNPIERIVHSGDELWVATSLGLFSQTNGLLDFTSPIIERDGQGGVWVADTGESTLVHLPSGVEVDLPRMPVAIAVESSASLWVADSSSIYRVRNGVIEAENPTQDVVDIYADNVDEVVILYNNGEVSVGFDQIAMASGNPLDFVFVTYAEKPRSASDGIPCDDDAEGENEAFITVEELVTNASVNREWLDDIPAPVAIGVTPHLARRVRDCELEESFEPVWSANNTELGALFHALPEESCAVDSSCYVDFLQSEVSPIRQLGLPVEWASGLTTHGDLGVDWVSALSDSGVSDLYIGFGLSALEGVRHEDDPRSKEPFSLPVARDSVPWSSSSLDSIEFDDPAGDILFMPGDNRAAFNLGSCENLFIWECYILGLGGHHIFSDEDIDSLDLLLHRAIATRQRDDVSTWHLHLPDIGSWDYTEGCSVSGREWSGDCGAALFQNWLIELHRTLALNGVISWSTPSRVGSN